MNPWDRIDDVTASGLARQNVAFLTRRGKGDREGPQMPRIRRVQTLAKGLRWLG
jgi:hypothetical protein